MSHYYPGEPSTWYTNGNVASPLSTSPLADTGAIAATGNYIAQVVISADATCTIAFQQRDTANATTVNEQRFFIPSGGGSVSPPNYWVQATANQRYRIIPVNNVSPGNVSASIFWQKAK